MNTIFAPGAEAGPKIEVKIEEEERKVLVSANPASAPTAAEEDASVSEVKVE